MARKPKILKNIFLSSIYQNAGKTTVSLGLFKALKERNLKTTFLKPVGQQVVRVKDSSIDKDSYLIGEIYGRGRKMKEMSPVTIAPGYTEKYIMNPHKDELQAKILKSFESLTKGKDAIIVEGTGHAGVGAVVDNSNADVAHLLGSKVIIISGGGIGRSIDEIILNKALFELKGVEILGVIVNKVRPDKYDRIQKAVGKGLENKGIKLLGVIPLEPLLSSPTIDQIKNLLNLTLLCGRVNVHKRVKHNIVAAMEPHHMIQYFKENTLVLTSGDRIDNILAAVSSHLVSESGGNKVAGIILSGGLRPNPKIVDLLKKSQIPILITKDDTYSVAAKMEHLIPKIQKTDKDKIEEATRLVKKYVDVDTILKAFEH